MSDHVKIHGIKPRIQYVADGTSTTYEFPFAIFDTEDINVYFGDVLQDTTTYTVTDIRQSDGGSVTFGTAPTSGTIITILRHLSVERTTDFQEGGALRADTLNDELDYQIACQQQIAENLNRAMVLPPYAEETDFDLTLPLPSAGKAIVWNGAGTKLENSTVEVNALESTLNTYKTEANNSALTAASQAAVATAQAETATTQAGVAATHAESATTQAGIAASKAQEAAASAEAFYHSIGNCITRIPQDINLELSAGTLTLKAGSKIYTPNGTNTFDTTTTASNLSTTQTSNAQYILCLRSGALYTVPYSAVCSGTSDTKTGVAYHVWYDTTNNVIKTFGSNGTTQEANASLPIAIITVSSGAISSIDRIFNGMGYIGSTRFYLPGLTYLIPNGRNADGTLKNTSNTLSVPFTRTDAGSSNIMWDALSVLNIGMGDYFYDNDTNYVYYNSKAPANIRQLCLIAQLKLGTNGAVTMFKPKTALHMVDYNDQSLVNNWGMPDYTGVVSLSTTTTSYTAPCNGYITFTAIGNNNTAYAYVDSVLVYESSSSQRCSNTFPIAKGSVFTRSGGSSIVAITFIPCQGV